MTSLVIFVIGFECAKQKNHMRTDRTDKIVLTTENSCNFAETFASQLRGGGTEKT